jgi:hypothetical protein
VTRRSLPVPTEGEKFEVVYPFVFDPTPLGFDRDGAPTDEGKWKPGILWRATGPEDEGAYAHAVGKQVLTVVGVFKPGRFPTRVFYTQAWIDPDGRKFGKNTCRVMPIEKFRRRTRGYGIPYQLEPA